MIYVLAMIVPIAMLLWLIWVIRNWDSSSPAAAVATGPSDDDLARGAEVLGRRPAVDDIRLIEGVGPKVEQLLAGIGITTWRDLADAPVERLRSMLTDAGSSFSMQDPSTWPRQAALLVEAKWDEFKELTDNLRGGREHG